MHTIRPPKRQLAKITSLTRRREYPDRLDDLRWQRKYGCLFNAEDLTIDALWKVRPCTFLTTTGRTQFLLFASRQGFRRGTVLSFAALRHERRVANTFVRVRPFHIRDHT